MIQIYNNEIITNIEKNLDIPNVNHNKWKGEMVYKIAFNLILKEIVQFNLNNYY